MRATFNSALAPGTYENGYKQATIYITFSLQYNVPYLEPNITQVCMFAQYLANRFPSISTVRNYMSGAKTWVLEHNGNIFAFLSHELNMVLKSLAKHSKHVVKRAAPLTLDHIISICRFIDAHVEIPPAVKPCLLIGFSCYLRSSNLLSPLNAEWGGPHALRRNHVKPVPGGLKVTILSTKTKSTPYELFVPSNPSPRLCPVLAWNKYIRLVSPRVNGPAFILNEFSTLSAEVVVSIMKQALQGSTDINPDDITMHSLRRGAVQSAETAGCQLGDIMERGGWASKSGINPYRFN